MGSLVRIIVGTLLGLIFYWIGIACPAVAAFPAGLMIVLSGLLLTFLHSFKKRLPTMGIQNQKILTELRWQIHRRQAQIYIHILVLLGLIVGSFLGSALSAGIAVGYTMVVAAYTITQTHGFAELEKQIEFEVRKELNNKH